MAYCINPSCQAPHNADSNSFCQHCGSSLLIRNRYRILKPLGEGGFGRTFIAEDVDKFNEPCVVKQLITQTQGTQANHTVVELFMREAQQLQRLRKNDQIPDLLAYFEEQGQLYLVQEYIAGDTLTQELKEQGHLTETQVQKIFREILPVLDFIHQEGVIHRDLKLDNLMRRQDDEKLMLIDFGISKTLSTTMATSASVMAGSWGYAAPEQMQEGGRISSATDLYALGVIGFQLLSGVNPWQLWQQQGYSWTQQWTQHLSAPINPSFGEILTRLLAYEPSQRYAQAKDVLQALQSSNDQNFQPAPLNLKPSSTSLNPSNRSIPPSTVLDKPAAQTHLFGIEKRLLLILGSTAFGLLTLFAIAFWGIPALFPNSSSLPKTPVVTSDPPPTTEEAKQFLQTGNQKFRSGNYQEAIADYNRAIEISPSFALAYNNRGSAKNKLGDLEGAIADFDQAIQLYPNYSEAYNNRGSAKSRLGNERDAISDFDQAIRLDSDSASARFNRGNSKLKLGEREDAIQDYDQAIQLDPKFVNAYNNRGRTKDTLGDFEGAIADYNKALELDPNNAGVYTNRGAAKHGLGDYEGAIADHNQSIQLDSSDTLAYTNRGGVKLKLKQFQAAIADFNQALQLDPQNASAYSNRGGAKSALGDREGAIADYDQAIRFNPNFGDAYYNRGVAKLAQGRKEEALQDYQKAAELYQQQGKISDYQETQKQIKRISKT